jgi:hypothetical protein
MLTYLHVRIFINSVLQFYIGAIPKTGRFSFAVLLSLYSLSHKNCVLKVSEIIYVGPKT